MSCSHPQSSRSKSQLHEQPARSHKCTFISDCHTGSTSVQQTFALLVLAVAGAVGVGPSGRVVGSLVGGTSTKQKGSISIGLWSEFFLIHVSVDLCVSSVLCRESHTPISGTRHQTPEQPKRTRGSRLSLSRPSARSAGCVVGLDDHVTIVCKTPNTLVTHHRWCPSTTRPNPPRPPRMPPRNSPERCRAQV